MNYIPKDKVQSHQRTKIIILLAFLFFVAAIAITNTYHNQKKSNHGIMNQKFDESPNTNNNQTNHTRKTTTYHNIEYWFKVEIPKDWEIDTNTTNIIKINSQESKAAQNDAQEGDYILPDLEISIHDNLYSLSGSKTIFNSLEEYIDSDPLLSNKRKIHISNNEAWEATEGGYSSNYTIIMEHNSYFYKLSFNKLDKSLLNETDKAIISSFQFTK